MRGYFVRDFYAKAVALVGLGALAGAGAIVDSWPSAATVQGPGAQAEVSAPVVARVASAPVASSPLGDLRLVAAAPRRAIAKPPAFARVAVGQARPLDVDSDFIQLSEAPPAAMPVSMATDIVLTSTEPVTMDAVFESTGSQVVGRVNADDSFISSALKKTGSSIAAIGALGARTGARTGASIVGAARAVGGAVKKALPL